MVEISNMDCKYMTNGSGQSRLLYPQYMHVKKVPLQMQAHSASVGAPPTCELDFYLQFFNNITVYTSCRYKFQTHHCFSTKPKKCVRKNPSVRNLVLYNCNLQSLFMKLVFYFQCRVVLQCDRLLGLLQQRENSIN